MPRYLVERPAPGGFADGPPLAAGAARDRIVRVNGEEGVTWLHSLVGTDGPATSCLYELYEGVSPEAVRRASLRNHLPITKIVEVMVLDPYGYR